MTIDPGTVLRCAAGTALCGLLLSATALFAQAGSAPENEAAPADEPVATTPERPDYLLPDVAPAALIHDGEKFWFKPIFAFVTDYTWFDQDAESLEQVGLQEDEGELRAGRLGFHLRSKSKFNWDFYTTTDFQEKRTREKTVFTVYDMRIGIPLGKRTRFNLGKQKEYFAYELTALSVLLPQQERVLLPFFVSRSIGGQFVGTLAGDRMSWAAGWFNDWLDTDEKRDRNETDYVGRLTGLVWTTPNDRDYLHLGLGLRRVGSDNGMMRFSGRPESNVADKYVDTGNFVADHANEVLFEALFVRGAFELLSEYVTARVDAPASGDPRFHGYYGTASWVVTGEGRHYVRSGGYAGLIVPENRFGAWELVARYSHVDLDDQAIDGGILGKWSLGVNWWVSTQWKAGLSWGDGDLDKGGLVGNTKMLLLRAQWLY